MHTLRTFFRICCCLFYPNTSSNEKGRQPFRKISLHFSNNIGVVFDCNDFAFSQRKHVYPLFLTATDGGGDGRSLGTTRHLVQGRLFGLCSEGLITCLHHPLPRSASFPTRTTPTASLSTNAALSFTTLAKSECEKQGRVGNQTASGP